MDLRDTLEQALGGLEDLVRKIPGYRGYKEKEMRREADRLLRDNLAQAFGDQAQRLVDVQGQLVAGGKIELLEQATDLEDAVRRLQTLVDRIKRAAQGYAGFFDAIKVKEKQLDALYEFDDNLLSQIDVVKLAVDDVQAAIDAGEGLPAAIANVRRIAGEVNQLFSQREQVIIGSE
jgi:ABC-type transporter Mla subunit MlaD